MSYSSVLAGIAGFTVRSRYKLDDTSGTTMTDSGVAAQNGTYTSSPTLAVAGIVTDGGTSVSTTAAGGYLASGTVSSMGLSGSGTILFWYIHGGATNPAIMANTGTIAANRSDLDLTSTNANLALRILGTTVTFTGAGSSVTDGLPHLTGLVYTNGVGWEVFVDGNSKGTNATNSNIAAAFAAMRWGRAQAGTTYNQTMDDIVIGNGAISGADQAALYAAGLAGGSTAASGTASLSLSASGSATAPGAGAGSLSLSAAGSAKAPATGAASLSLSAAGTGAAPIAATAALSLSATGSAQAPATGTASITLTAVGAATSGSQPAAGDAALTLSATATGQAAATGLAAITISGSGAGAGQVVGLAAFELSASAVAAGALNGNAQIDLSAAGLVAAPTGGTAFLVLTGDGSGHGPFRDVTVLAIVDVSRLVRAADASRGVSTADVSRLVRAALIDGSKKMKLDPSAREFYAITIDTDPQVSAWQASFDGRTTWFDGELVQDTDNKFRWLVRGPDFDPTGQAVATSIPLPLATIKPVIRASDDPEVMYRGSSDAKVPSITVKASG